MDTDQILAFRLARSGLAARKARTLADAAACPASDFARDAALLALAARAKGVTREAYDRAVDAGKLVVAHVVRGAIHALSPVDHALWGRALIAEDDDELAAQLGQQVKGLAAEKGFAPTEALDEVATATKDALAAGNRAYEEKFGRVFLVCATGRTAASMLEELERRMQNDAATEHAIAVAEQRKITRLRLEKLLRP